MKVVAGHNPQVLQMPIAGRQGATEPWLVCECGFNAKVMVVLRTNLDLVTRLLYLEHLVDALTDTTTP